MLSLCVRGLDAIGPASVSNGNYTLTFGSLLPIWRDERKGCAPGHGAAELIYLIGLYCLVSVTLNVPVPEAGAT